MNIQEISITDDMLIKAREKAVEMGRLNNSILNGGGNLAGFIGEQIVLGLSGGKWTNTYDYDISIPFPPDPDDPDSGFNLRVDVKTKQTSVKPLPHYECSIAEIGMNQKCDYYAFTRVKKDFSVGWYLGAMEKEEYFKKAKFLKKGDVDPSNNFKVRTSCYNLPISELDTSPTCAIAPYTWKEINK